MGEEEREGEGIGRELRNGKGEEGKASKWESEGN